VHGTLKLRHALLSFFVAFLLMRGARVEAQAWVSPKGEGYVALSYQYSRVNDHLWADAGTRDLGHVRTNLVDIFLAYNPTDRLAVSFGVPYVVAKYSGKFPHQDHVDGGHSHGTYQDYRLDLRYQVLRGTTAVTPFIQAIIPTHDYEFFAHSAVGRRLNERTAGVYVGRPIGAILPNAYVQGRISYSFVDQEIDMKANHFNLDLDGGYFVTDKLAARVLMSVYRTDGGVDIDQLGSNDGELFHHHDQVLRERHINLGAGMSYAMTDATDVFFSALRTMHGANGHKIDLSVTVGAGWTFGAHAKP
jgi:hypothetical protein